MNTFYMDIHVKEQITTTDFHLTHPSCIKVNYNAHSNLW